jgi:type VII secretion-associated protein (TIGR03931 family)
VIAANVETGCESLIVVHPSWWPQQRVERIVDAAATIVTDIRTLSRSAAIAGETPATVVEIADDVVAITAPGEQPVVVARADDPGDIARTIETDSDATVLVDAPPGVAGAIEYARAISAALRQRGLVARLGRIRDVPPPAPKAEPVPAIAPRRWRAAVLAALSVIVTLGAMGIAASRTHPPAPAIDAVNIVEGRVTLLIPPQWALTRITAGPGSRRIQASSPTEPNVALHVTQSFSPGETLDRTADVLRQAVAEQPRGVFVEFNPTDRRGGRPAVTYREVRVSRDIRWTVVLDGSTRISIGCQSAPGREDTVAQACEKAIESAHELAGTKGGS